MDPRIDSAPGFSILFSYDCLRGESWWVEGEGVRRDKDGGMEDDG